MFILRFLLLVFPLGLLAGEPVGLLLTWKTDPCTTMVIDWHVEGESAPALFVREKGAESWTEHAGTPGPFPFTKRRVFRQYLKDLKPGSEYEFRFGPEGRRYSFRTMPETLSRPVRFAIGGDTRHSLGWWEAMNRVAVGQDIDFAVLGGDLAYENGTAGNVNNVIEWFDGYKNTFVTEAGRVVPVLVILGNHEVRGGYVNGLVAEFVRDENLTSDPEVFREKIAPYFYALFASPGQPGYRAIDFGNYLSFLLLDSNHTNFIAGGQTDWLAGELERRKGRPNVFPVYHVPAYPSVREFANPVSQLVREHWVPLFEKNGVKYAFENHDHAYKRTPPIKAGKADPAGIVFVGDGAWGVGPREVHPVEETWYLEKALSIRHCIIATLGPDTISFRVLDEASREIDRFP